MSEEPAVARYDYIVVGGGSAGCVLANRLSADPAIRVLLIEAGPRDRTWKIHMPAALTYNLRDTRYNWFYETEPQPHMDGRRLYWPRGRVLGGSSSLNAMVYVRGHACDYDRWARETGFEHWSHAHVLPYFKRAETRQKGGDAYRGDSGPLHVSTASCENPLFGAFLEAGRQAGYPSTADMNGFQQEGFGPMDMTIHRGRRWSTSVAYLRPARRRKNLVVEVGATATRILFEGTRAVGVEFGQRGRLAQARAEREVILAGGAINSPQLLMLSGVGNAEALRALGIPLVKHLPGVGRNLQDHLELYVQHACTEPITLFSATKLPAMLAIGLRWFLLRSGPGASSHLEAGGFVRSRPDVRHPDIQYHFLPSAVRDHGRIPPDRHAFQVHVGTLRATSAGWIELRSADPRQHPLIQPNYLATEQDRTDLRVCVKLARELFAQKAFDRYRGPELQPGNQVNTDVEIDAFVRTKAESAYHPSCTCRMGQDELAVVDGELRVRGVEALRVVDASIMPSIVSGNLNAPTIMIAEKAADMILGHRPLPPEHVPVYAASDGARSNTPADTLLTA
jgi:choline dehydrogenase